MRIRALCAFAVACAASGCGDNTHVGGGTLLISPQVGLRTNETGAAATFTVSLTNEQVKDVDVSIVSLDLAEGTVSPDTLHFTPVTYDVPQLVTVHGVDDAKADGNKTFIVRVDGGKRGVVDLTIINDDDDTAGFVVSPLVGLMTSEAGAQASFTVRLLSQPAASVTIPVASSDATEGTTNVSSLTFTEQSWNVDQTVFVTGMPDALADGNVPYSVVLAPAMSADLTYKDLDPDDPLLQNLDANVQGVTVTPIAGLATTEAAGTDTFQVVLQSAPTANVTFAIASSDTTEATVSTSQLLFTPTNWMTPQVVTVTGVNDFVVDGAQPFTITIGAATTTDPMYTGVNPPDVTGSNADNDTAGIIVTGGASGLTTTEAAGGTDSFSVTLQSQPTANVTIPVSSSDTTEGTVSPASLLFTPADWNQPHTVTVTGVDDTIADGDQPYTVILAAATSTDSLYSGMNAADVNAINIDNDQPGFTIDPDSLTVSEFQDADFFTIVLNTPPTANVTVNFTSTDTTEGTVSPTSVTFTPQNWNVPQTVYVTGVNDTIPDGPQSFMITTSAAISNDPAYNGVNPIDVAVVNIDNDTATVYVKARNRLQVSESGQSATFRVRLTIAPTAPVTCTIQSSDTTEGTVSPTSLTFTPGQFGFQTVTVTGVDDTIVDGPISFSIRMNACTSNDLAYNGSDPRDVAVVNRDND